MLDTFVAIKQFLTGKKISGQETNQERKLSKPIKIYFVGTMKLRATSMSTAHLK